MTTEATQENLGVDVAEQTTTHADKAAVVQVSERQALMDSITAERRAERDAENELKPGATAENDDPEDEPAAATKDKQADPTAAPVHMRDGKWYSTLKVDGVEMEVPYEQAIATAQKNISADKRLEAAAEAEKSVRGKALLLAQEEKRILAAITAAKATGQVKPSATDASDLKTLSREYHKKLLEGDEDGATEIMATMMEGRRPATPEVDDATIKEHIRQAVPAITREVETRAAASRIQSDLDTTVAKFYGDRKDIAGDKILKNMHDLITADVIEEKTGLSVNDFLKRGGTPDLDFKGVMAEAAKRLDTRMGRTMQDRTERKKNLATPAVGASATIPAQREEPEMTRDAYREKAMDEIRKKRGQAA
ncbi:hypothetical protein [Sphingomonas sp.]|jgi:hypothetical protein|uniref:hypothetical protein n=1 Tax=Sphingomonas sp. TaxID=28214 RepID=UPI003565942A